MTAPHVYTNIAYDAATGIVTADGQQFALDVFLEQQVASGRAHNINEARVQIGLPQIPTLPASPDGAGNPTFTVGAVAQGSGYTQTAGAQTAAPAILPIPPASAPVAAHASFWSSFWSYFSHAAVVTGHSLTNPAVLAAAAPFVPPKYQGIVGAIGVIEQVAEAPRTPAQ